MYIVGTAGHVDHGKSTLVTALTGTNPDRLKEEQTREMTIDLGFASLTLPNGELIGLVDVPGHRNFIGNMLAGVGGIDAALLIIAADEGISAQTREHLHILDLLEIQKGIVVLTKLDLVTDLDLLELVRLETLELLAGTSLENAPIVAVSAKSGDGLEELRATLQNVLADTTPKRDLKRPRLPIDRVFTMSGFGTVVTGTLLDGSFSNGTEVEILPKGISARIRGLQNHRQKLQKVNPGFRVAMNLSGVDKSDLHRGDVVISPGSYKASKLLDVHFRALSDLKSDIKHNLAVKLYIGTCEVDGKLRLLGKNALQGGETAFLQLRLTEPLVAERGDHYILRLPSPSETLGGGTVLNPHPARMTRRFDAGYLNNLQSLFQGQEGDIFLQMLQAIEPASLNSVAVKSSLGLEEALALTQTLLESEDIVLLKPAEDPGRNMLMSQAGWTHATEAILTTLTDYHAANPAKFGMPRQALKTLSKLNQESFDLLISKLLADKVLISQGSLVSLSGHFVQLSPAQEQQARGLLAKFEQNPYTPPSQSELLPEYSAELLEAMVAVGYLTRISDEILFTPAAVKELKQWVEGHIQTTGSLTLAEFRDYFKTSRKYAAPFLEYLDSIGITVRKGDMRELRRVQS